MTPMLSPTGSLEMTLPLPPARFKKGVTALPWRLMDVTSYRPGYNLTPDRIWGAYRQAEINNPAPQCDLFEDVLENDGHFRGQWISRLSAVAFRPWTIRPGGRDPIDLECAEALLACLRRTNMMELLWHLMEGIGYGWSSANIAWDFIADENGDKIPEAGLGLVAPTWFLPAPHRRFLVGLYTDILKWRSEGNPYPGDDLLPGHWITARRPGRKVVRAGVFRTTTWWAFFKRASITDWIVFAEKFGIPISLGYYQERASDQSRRVLEQALIDLGEDGQAVLADTTKLVFEQPNRGGDVQHLHPAIADRCDAEISKLVTGATLNVSSGGPGSFALGKVHEGRATQLQFADAFWLQEIFEQQVCAAFVLYNPKFAKAKTPRLHIRVQPEMDPKTMVDVYSTLQGMGLAIEDEQMYETFGLRRPADGDALKPINVAPPKPSTEQPEPPPGKSKQPAKPAK